MEKRPPGINKLPIPGYTPHKHQKIIQHLTKGTWKKRLAKIFTGIVDWSQIMCKKVFLAGRGLLQGAVCSMSPLSSQTAPLKVQLVAAHHQYFYYQKLIAPTKLFTVPKKVWPTFQTSTPILLTSLKETLQVQHWKVHFYLQRPPSSSEKPQQY